MTVGVMIIMSKVFYYLISLAYWFSSFQMRGLVPPKSLQMKPVYKKSRAGTGLAAKHSKMANSVDYISPFLFLRNCVATIVRQLTAIIQYQLLGKSPFSLGEVRSCSCLLEAVRKKS